jgi:hypothetical protein
MNVKAVGVKLNRDRERPERYTLNYERESRERSVESPHVKINHSVENMPTLNQH